MKGVPTLFRSLTAFAPGGSALPSQASRALQDLRREQAEHLAPEGARECRTEG